MIELEHWQGNYSVKSFISEFSYEYSCIYVHELTVYFEILFSDPPIPYIKHHDFIKTVFPEDYSNILWLYAAHTFPLFCKLLELPEYTERIMIGLIASIGQLTESLVRFEHRLWHMSAVKLATHISLTYFSLSILLGKIFIGSVD